MIRRRSTGRSARCSSSPGQASRARSRSATCGVATATDAARLCSSAGADPECVGSRSARLATGWRARRDPDEALFEVRRGAAHRRFRPTECRDRAAARPLPDMLAVVLARSLPQEPFCVHRACTRQAAIGSGPFLGAARILFRHAPLRRLWRGRSDRPRTRSSRSFDEGRRGLELDAASVQVGDDSDRDREVRCALCQLPSTSYRVPAWLVGRGVRDLSSCWYRLSG